VRTNDHDAAVARSHFCLCLSTCCCSESSFVVALFFDSLYYGYHLIVETMDQQGFYIRGLIYSLHLLFLHVIPRWSDQAFISILNILPVLS